MTTTFSHRLSSLVLGCAAALVVMGCATPSHAQSVAVMVNGDPITNYDIEQRSKLNFLTTHKPADRQQVVNELIDEKLKIKEAKKYGVDPSASDIDQAFGEMSRRMRITPDQLTKSLESQGIRPDTLKARIRADMVWTSLVRGRFKESLQVGEKDVAAAVQASGGDEKQEADAFEYKMQPIVLIVPRGSAPAVIEGKAEGGRNPAQPRADAAPRPTPSSSRCRMPRYAISWSRPRPTCRRLFVKCSTRPRSAI